MPPEHNLIRVLRLKQVRILNGCKVTRRREKKEVGNTVRVIAPFLTTVAGAGPGPNYLEIIHNIF